MLVKRMNIVATGVDGLYVQLGDIAGAPLGLAHKASNEECEWSQSFNRRSAAHTGQGQESMRWMYLLSPQGCVGR